MGIKVRLFAALVVYVPGAKPGVSFEVELPDGASLSDLVSHLDLPQSEVKVIFINGRAQPLHHKLQNNDEVGVFPLIAGG